jgi:hypothetical protein
MRGPKIGSGDAAAATDKAWHACSNRKVICLERADAETIVWTWQPAAAADKTRNSAERETPLHCFFSEQRLVYYIFLVRNNTVFGSNLNLT